MMTGSLKKIKNKNKKKKGGCSVIRACSLIRSNTVSVFTGIFFLWITHVCSFHKMFTFS